jgi:hypothetical protein
MGKGSNPRPFEIPQEEFLSNWEKTFGKKNQSESEQTEPNEPDCVETK